MIFIPFNTPSLKNSKPNGRFHSPSVRKYLQKLGVKSFSSSRKMFENYKTRPNLFDISVAPLRSELKEMARPVHIGFHFVRDSRRKFDFINAMQIILDLMTAHNVIEDDNCDIVIPYVLEIDGKSYVIDKVRSGCFVKIGK